MTKARRSSRPASGTGLETSTRCIVSRRSRDAARQYPSRQEPGLLSLLTHRLEYAAPNTSMRLADSVLSQDADSTFEWVLLDNGSRRSGHQGVGRAPGKRAWRSASFASEHNLGIIGGMRFCLERAIASIHRAGRFRRSADARLLPCPFSRAAAGRLSRPRLHRRRQAGGQPLQSAVFQARDSIPSSLRTRATRRILAPSTASWRWSSAPTPTGGPRAATTGTRSLGSLPPAIRRCTSPRCCTAGAFTRRRRQETSIQSPSCTTRSAAS